MEKIIMHIDVNNAFLSWTAIFLLNNGYKYDIRNSYAVIGGDEKTRSGVVLAKSLPAKKAGVNSGETLYQARQKCKILKVYPPNYKFYQEMSDQLFSLLAKYTDDIEIASIDECYLDYGKVKNLYGDQYEFALKIQKEIYETLKFTVNIGIANNKLCAKMASDFSKPNKIHTLYNNEIETKMYPLPIGDLFGIGKKTAAKLEALNIKTIGSLANSDIVFLEKYFKNQALVMINWAKGIDNSEVNNKNISPDSISNEITLEKDALKKSEIEESLLYLSEKLGLRIRSQNKYASVIAVVLKDNFFKRFSHQRKLKNPTNSSKEIYETSKSILNEMTYERVRLIGIRLDKLTDQELHQVSLFENFEEEINNNELDLTVDKLKNKYGKDIIKKATLISKKNKDRLK